MRRQRIYWLASLALVAVLLLQVFTAGQALAQTNTENVRVSLSGPGVIGTERSGEYFVTVNDPEGRDWKYKVYVTAANTTGASPLEDSPAEGNLTAENRTASFTVTGTTLPGEIEIHVNCTSGDLYYERVQPITVVEPIVLSADIYNPGSVTINNATVRFLVDGVEVDSKTVDSLGPKKSITVSTEWISADVSPGWHDSTILVDLDSDGVIDKDSGEMEIKDRFYVEGGSDWLLIVTVFAGVSALLLGMGYLSRRKIK